MSDFKTLTEAERNSLGVNLLTIAECMANVAKLAAICTDCWRPFTGKRCYCEDNVE